MKTHRFAIGPAEAGLRLDQAIAAKVEELSRRAAKELISVGGVFVNRQRIKRVTHQVAAGDRVEVHVGSAVTRQQQELPPPAILFEDGEVVVVLKAAGVLTAPTPESDKHNLFWQLRGTRKELYLIHRLDMPTSGVLVFAKTPRANKVLSEAFASHRIARHYEAVVVGVPTRDTFEVTVPVEGKPARSRFAVITRFPQVPAAHLRVELYTGRTHQIRLHAHHVGHAVLGDRSHGSEASARVMPRAPRLMLHAAHLGFTHPTTGAAMAFDAPPPAEFSDYLAQLAAAPAST